MRGPWCGTSGGYTNHRCRCLACTEAWRVAHQAYLDRHPEQQEKQRESKRRYAAARRGKS